VGERRRTLCSFVEGQAFAVARRFAEGDFAELTTRDRGAVGCASVRE